MPRGRSATRTWGELSAAEPVDAGLVLGVQRLDDEQGGHLLRNLP